VQQTTFGNILSVLTSEFWRKTGFSFVNGDFADVEKLLFANGDGNHPQPSPLYTVKAHMVKVWLR
jgi:hypothetical protein